MTRWPGKIKGFADRKRHRDEKEEAREGAGDESDGESEGTEREIDNMTMAGGGERERWPGRIKEEGTRVCARDKQGARTRQVERSRESGRERDECRERESGGKRKQRKSAREGARETERARERARARSESEREKRRERYQQDQSSCIRKVSLTSTPDLFARKYTHTHIHTYTRTHITHTHIHIEEIVRPRARDAFKSPGECLTIYLQRCTGNADEYWSRDGGALTF